MEKSRRINVAGHRYRYLRHMGVKHLSGRLPVSLKKSTEHSVKVFIKKLLEDNRVDQTTNATMTSLYGRTLLR